MRETKKISYKELKIGQEVYSYNIDGCSHMASIKILEITPLFVKMKVFDREEIIPTEGVTFTVDLTEKEIQEKYKIVAKEVIKNIQNKLQGHEIGFHEMWNCWCSYDPYEMASYCVKEDIKIIGHCTDITPHYICDSLILDVGICAGYIETGERFWCHEQLKSLQGMLEDYAELLE